MPRVIGVDIPGKKRVEYALRYIYGVGPTRAKELVERLKNRKTDTAEDLSLRIATARQELRQADGFDYVVVNADCHLKETVDTVMAIIDAEHHRVHPRKVIL